MDHSSTGRYPAAALPPAYLTPGSSSFTDFLRAQAPDLVDELAAACHKVELARRFHNDHVTSARALRSRRRVRWFHLSGHAPEPTTVDLDDVPPAGLDGP